MPVSRVSRSFDFRSITCIPNVRPFAKCRHFRLCIRIRLIFEIAAHLVLHLAFCRCAEADNIFLAVFFVSIHDLSEPRSIRQPFDVTVAMCSLFHNRVPPHDARRQVGIKVHFETHAKKASRGMRMFAPNRQTGKSLRWVNS